MMKKVLVVAVLLLIFSVNVSAEEYSAKEIYGHQFEESGAGGLFNALPPETAKFLRENGIDPENYDFTENLTAENVFSHIWNFLKSGAKTPFTAAVAVLAIILISAALSSAELGGVAAKTSLYATALSSAAVICAPALSVISAASDAMQGCAVFMTSFVPVFAVITASSGAAATAASMSALLLGASQTVNFIANFVVVPLMSGYMAISLAASVSPVVSRSGIADGIKKLGFWIMSLLTTVFIGILSIQTSVNAAADTLSVRAAKFIIGSSVPVAGTVVSEALTTVTASMGLLKSTVGVYGVIACCALFLPLLAELVIWRLSLVLTSTVSDLFEQGKISSLLRCVDTVFSVLIGLILLTCVMFIISLAVVVKA